jgi:oxygen-independent coproporphyrinogen-3 oxidase
LYGSVNFSRNSKETGTSPYFENRLLNGLPYIGVGNYSSSWIDDYWFFNVRGVNEYIEKINTGESVIGDYYKLPKAELYAKYILYSLNFGLIDEERFQKRFGIDFSLIFQKELHFAIKKGWIKKEGSLWLIPYGQFKSLNYLRSLFYSDTAKKWLMGI